MHTRKLLVACLLIVAAACGGKDSPTSPTPVGQTPTPTTTTTSIQAISRITVFGIVRNSDTGGPVGGATVRATNATTQTNLTATTDGNGYYSLAGVGTGQVTLEFTAPQYNAFTARPTFDRDAQFDQRITPFWARAGSGNTVFDMPTHVRRVRITGRYDSSGSNFIIRIGGRLVVNEILGRSWESTTYNGLHLTSGGIVEITNSRDVQWTFAQEQ